MVFRDAVLKVKRQKRDRTAAGSRAQRMEIRTIIKLAEDRAHVTKIAANLVVPHRARFATDHCFVRNQSSIYE